jgi:hypothetical protein
MLKAYKKLIRKRRSVGFASFEEARKTTRLLLLWITATMMAFLLIASIIGGLLDHIVELLTLVGAFGVGIYHLYGAWFKDMRIGYAFLDRHSYMGIGDEFSSSRVMNSKIVEISKIYLTTCVVKSFDGKIINLPYRRLIDDFKVEKCVARNIRVTSRELVVHFPVAAYFELSSIHFLLVREIMSRQDIILLPQEISGESAPEGAHTDFYCGVVTVRGVKYLRIEVTTNGGDLRLEKETVPNFLDEAFSRVLKEKGLSPKEMRITPCIVH